MLYDVPHRPVIAGTGAGAYIHRMLTRFIRLIALMALALMPLGIMSAPAAAAAPAMQSGHCDDHHQPASEPSEVSIHCLNCAGLPAFELTSTEARTILPAVHRKANVLVFSGIDPEIATPPPKGA